MLVTCCLTVCLEIDSSRPIAALSAPAAIRRMICSSRSLNAGRSRSSPTSADRRFAPARPARQRLARQHRVAAGRQAQRAHEFVGAGVLQQVAATHPQRAHRARRSSSAEAVRTTTGVRAGGGDELANRVDPRDVRHLEVDHDDVGVQLPGERDRLGAVRRLAHDRDAPAVSSSRIPSRKKWWSSARTTLRAASGESIGDQRGGGTYLLVRTGASFRWGRRCTPFRPGEARASRGRRAVSSAPARVSRTDSSDIRVLGKGASPCSGWAHAGWSSSPFRCFCS